MKLLFFSNYFPPAAVGGYEQWCQEVAQALAARGHEVKVITSRAGVDDGNVIPVHRVIELEVTGGVRSTIGRFLRRKHLEASSLAAIERLVQDTQPDAALIWGMWNVPRSVPALVERLIPDRTAYYFCDYWPTLPGAFVEQLSVPAKRKVTALPKRLVARALLRKIRETSPLEFRHPICVSQAVRRILLEAGVQIPHAKVIYGGTEAPTMATQKPNGAVVRLLYLGRLTPDKGLHTAIEAVHVVAERALTVQLDVYGQGDASYLRSLRNLLKKHNLESAVRLMGSISRADVPALLSQYDALVFPSEWNEPFARTVLEAMAASLLVIGTTTGGTGEILGDRETGLTFKAGDALGLADQIDCLSRDCVPFRKFAEAGRNAVLQRFSLKQMVDQIEEALASIAKSNSNSNSNLTLPRAVSI
jgi:glycogen(starch) synthase